MILELVESDKPKTFGEKISEIFSQPPQPVLRFYGTLGTQLADGKRHVLFAVRNGLPIPLLYGIYVKAEYDTLTDYMEKTEHIGPFSIDDWRLTLDDDRPAQLEIRAGLVPVEICTDRVFIAI